MAVSLVPFDLMQPAGELDSAWFPGANLEALIAAALHDAASVVETNSDIAAANHNRAAASYVYARLYRIVASRLAATPQTLTIAGQITKVTDSSRVAYFENLAAAKEAEYAGYIVTSALDGYIQRSTSATVYGTW